MEQAKIHHDAGNIDEALKILGIDLDKAERYYVAKSFAKDEGKEEEFKAQFQGTEREVQLAMENARLKREHQTAVDSQYDREMAYWKDRLGKDEDVAAINEFYGKPDYATSQILRIYNGLPEDKRTMDNAFSVAKDEFRHLLTRLGKAPATSAGTSVRPASINPPSAGVNNLSPVGKAARPIRSADDLVNHKYAHLVNA